MSKEQIEVRIRGLFNFLFGIVFTGLFILVSSYVKLNNDSTRERKSQVEAFIIDGLKMRETLLFEDYMTDNFAGVALRIHSFLKKNGISDSEVILEKDGKCIYSKVPCQDIDKSLLALSRSKKISSTSFNDFLVVLPMEGWGSNHGNIIVKIPVNEISNEPRFFQTLFFYIIPFVVLMFLSFLLFNFAEKKLIRPTIKKIIEAEKLSTQRETIAQFAHDIKSPLAVLNIAVNSFEKDLETSKVLLLSAIDRIGNISSDLLAENQKFKALAESDIETIIKEVIDDKKVEYSSRNCYFEYTIESSVKHVTFNKNDFYRVLSNLINNSIESVEQKIKPVITLKVSIENETLRCTISDNGCGMAKDDMNKALKGRFSSKQNGNGLGLSGSKKWANKLGGDLHLDSILGMGTQVNLILPQNISEHT